MQALDVALAGRAENSANAAAPRAITVFCNGKYRIQHPFHQGARSRNEWQLGWDLGHANTAVLLECHC